MSNEANKAQQPTPATKKVRLRTNYLYGRDAQGEPQIHAAGTVIDLPTAEADALLGRNFEGYPSVRDARWDESDGSCGGATVAARPGVNGKVKDALAELV